MPQIEIFEDRAIFISGPIHTHRHKHHALEIIIGLTDAFKIGDEESPKICTRAAMVLPNQYHQTIAHSGETVFLFIEPESDLASRIVHHIGKEVSILNIEKNIPPGITQSGAVFIQEFINQFVNEQGSERKLDERIKHIVSYIKSNLTNQEIDLDALAAEACLSAGRLTHLFKNQIGIPIRPYILWCRIQAAVIAVLSGMNLTQAAHQSGFADSAHLSRTFVDMFGINPSSVLKQ